MKNIFVTIAMVLSAVALTLSLFSFFKADEKVVFVRSAVVVEQYQGMNEALKVFESEKIKLQSNFDTLQSDYKLRLEQYNQDKNKLSTSALKNEEEILLQQQRNIQQYAQLLEQKMAEKDQELTQGVYQQIDVFIKKYAEEKGYKLVLGTNNTGNVLYGDDVLDVTDELIKALNDSYQK